MENDILDFVEGNEPKARHGCVTAWLVFMLIANTMSALMYLFGTQIIQDAFPGEPSSGLVYALAFVAVINIVAAVLLFQYKRIGFFLFIGTSLAAVVLNVMIGISMIQAVMGLAGIAILYGILQIPQGRKSTWQHLD